jgi:hypothetical protein
MRSLKTFGRFWYDFIVGDDWRVAIGAVAAIALLRTLRNTTVSWLLLPAIVVVLLGTSLHLATRLRQR